MIYALFGAVVFLLMTNTSMFFMLKKARRAPREIESSLNCPYCTITVTGAKQLDLINHVACIGRAEEDLASLREKAIEKAEDVYFTDTRSYKFTSWAQVPDKWRTVAYWSNSGYNVHEGKIYRNGELLKSVYGRGQAATNEFAEREITIDKHKRQSKTSA